MKLSSVQKLAITVGAAMLLVGGVGAVSYYYASRLVENDRLVERANGNIAAALKLVVSRQEAERTAKAYIVRPDSTTRAGLAVAQARAEDAVDVLTRGTEDNPRQFEAMQALARGVSENFGTFRAAVMLRDRAGADSARRVLTSDLSARTADSLSKLVSEIRDEELRVLAERTRLRSVNHASEQRIILVGMIVAFLLAGLALQPVRSPVATRLTAHLVRQQGSSGSGGEDGAAGGGDGAALRLEAVHALAASLSGARDTTTAASAIVAAAASLDAAVTAVVRPTGDGGLEVLAALPAAFVAVPRELEPTVRDVLRTGAAAVCGSRSARDQQWGSQPALDAAGGSGGALAAPLTGEGATLGVVLVVLAADDELDDSDVTFAATLGRLGGLAPVFRNPSP
jgi:CHASE3 domain sensor protein